MDPAPTVLFHPENAADPATVIWRVTEPTISRATTTPPQPLAVFITQGILSDVRVEPGCIVTTLAPDQSWSASADQVRAAVGEALATMDQWSWVVPVGSLNERVQEVITRVVGPIAAGHGGSIILVSCDEGVVRVKLAGACKGCPASEVTLQDRLRQALAVEVPEVTAVEAVNSTSLGGFSTPAQALWRTITTRAAKDPEG